MRCFTQKQIKTCSWVLFSQLIKPTSVNPHNKSLHLSEKLSWARVNLFSIFQCQVTRGRAWSAAYVRWTCTLTVKRKHQSVRQKPGCCDDKSLRLKLKRGYLKTPQRKKVSIIMCLHVLLCRQVLVIWADRCYLQRC